MVERNGIEGVKTPLATSDCSGRPLRVLFVKDTLGHAGGLVTGGTTYMFETLRRFDRKIIEPMLCILAPRHPAATRFEAVGIFPMFLSRKKWDPRALIDLVRILRRHHVHLLHIEGKKSLILARIAAHITGHPVIAHLHDTYPVGPCVRFLIRRTAPWTSASLAVSEEIRDRGIHEFAILSERIEVLHNGHDMARFFTPGQEARQRIRQELGLSDATPMIGLIGRIVTTWKGQDLMIRAMPMIVRRCPNATLIIVGEGPDRQACQSLVEDLGLNAAVRFIGQRNDMPDLLAAMDVVAIPSRSEGLPYVALEAAAAGRPVVGFRTGGIPEIVVEGETGLLVSKEDIQGLADAVGLVLVDADLHDRLGIGGRQRAQLFTVERHVRKLEEIYEQTMRRWHRTTIPVSIDS